jgi:hypothetical protein
MVEIVVTRPAERVVAFYNKRGRRAMDQRRQGPSSGRGCRAERPPRFQLHALAYNLGNFLRTLTTPEPIKDWSLTSLKEKLRRLPVSRWALQSFAYGQSYPLVCSLWRRGIGEIRGVAS